MRKLSQGKNKIRKCRKKVKMKLEDYKKQFCNKEQKVIFTPEQEIKNRDDIIFSLLELKDEIRNYLCFINFHDMGSFQGMKAYDLIRKIDSFDGHEEGFSPANRIPKSCKDFQIEFDT